MAAELLLGYGNIDRMDDGLAWHVLAGLYAALHLPPLPSPDDALLTVTEPADCLFVLQLTPELAEVIARYQRVCFIDAHQNNDLDETQLCPVEPVFAASPFTHHLTPGACLALAQALYGRAPEAVVASARGEAFGFARELSPATARRVPELVNTILAWLTSPMSPTLVRSSHGQRA
jgi:hydrogenase maturation protease